MATKIQLRRDTSANWQGTNPVLAQGEPGVELDTKKMKVGDGIQAWNDLDYVAAGNEENSVTDMFVKLDGMQNDIGPYFAGVVSVSTDGLNWTPSTYNDQFTDYEAWEVYGLAVGNGRIVYRTYDYGSNRDSLRWALNPFDKPNQPQGTNSDVTRLGPNGEEISWHNIRYAGDKFVAVGSYYDNDRNDYTYPYAVYSTDGDNWTRINIDLDYVHSVIATEDNANSDVNGLEFQDVAYGDGGWLFVNHWGPYDSTGGTNNFANAFYVTDLTAQVGQTNLITGIPGSNTVKFDGKGWVTWSNYNNSNMLYINRNIDPRTGSWNEVNIQDVSIQLTGTAPGGIEDVVAGTIKGEHWIVVGTHRHGAFASKDQGASWKFLQTGARGAYLNHISNTSPAYFTSWNGYINFTNNGEKVTVQGSNIDQLNGTFYINWTGSEGYLYANYDPNTDTFTGPLDASSWGDVNVWTEVYVTEVNYGDHTFTVDDASNLRVGMGATYGSGWSTLENNTSMFDPNVITAIDGNKVTMKYPWHYNNDSGFNAYFYPVVTNTRGDGITSMAYGDGAFIGFSSSDGSRAYRTTDLNTWTKTTRGNTAQFGPWAANFQNSVAYGTVTTPGSTLINNSETIPGYASYLSVGDSFKVSVAGGDPEWTNSALAEGFSTGFVEVDPDLSQWYMGVLQDVEGFNNTNYLMIGTYQSQSNWYGNHRHDSVKVESADHNWNFDNHNGYFDTYNLHVNGANGMYLYTSNGEITVNGPFDGYMGSGEGYAQLTWGDVINSVKVDWYGTHINTEGHAWDFTSDYNGTSGSHGVLYAPRNAGIEVEGYWWIGDYQNNNYGHSHTYIQATDWSNSYPVDLLFSAEGYDGSAFYVMNRYGDFKVDSGDGKFVTNGYWAIGDYYNSDSYTYIGATDNVDSGAYDIEIAADDTYWYFNRTGTFQLPAGGDIVDSNGDTVLVRDMVQTVMDNGDYVIQLNDRGRHIYVTSAGVLYVPTNASIAFPIGSVITVVTNGGNATHIRAVDSNTTTLVLSKTGPANPTTGIAVGADTYVTMLKVEADRWMVQVA